MMNELQESSVRNTLTSKWVGRNYHYIESVGSTNDLLKKQVAEANPPAGTVILTNFQSKGRGRLDRRWEAPPDTSLLFSLLFRPNWPTERSSWLTMIAGTAVAEAIEAKTGLNASLKWPNDVVIKYEGIWHKVCGILLEGHVKPESGLTHAILGIGINVNSPADQLPQTSLPATSLSAVLGRQVSRVNLLTALLQRIEKLYDLADAGTSPFHVWQKRLITIGKHVQVTSSDRESAISGIAEGTGEMGELLVRDDHGKLHEIIAGDVSLRHTPPEE